MIFVAGDFDSKLTHKYCIVKNLFFTSTLGLYQFMNGPTHVIKISLSGIQLIFTSPPNLVIESVVHDFSLCKFSSAYKLR